MRKAIGQILVAIPLVVATAHAQERLDAYRESQQKHELSKRQHEMAKLKLRTENDKLILGNAGLDFKEREAAAKRIAIAKHPALGDKSSQFYKLVQQAIPLYRKLNPEFFKRPDWPLSIAEETATFLSKSSDLHEPYRGQEKAQKERETAVKVPKDYEEAQRIINYLETMLLLAKDSKQRQKLARALALFKATAPSPPHTAPQQGAVESHIAGEFKGWEGKTVFKLDNGQIWQQAEFAFHYHYAFRPAVIIYPTSAGWKMKVEGVKKSILVRRLK